MYTNKYSIQNLSSNFIEEIQVLIKKSEKNWIND